MLVGNQAIQNCYGGPVSALPSLQTFLRLVVGHRLVGVTARISHGVRDPHELLQAGGQKLSGSHPGCSLPCEGWRGAGVGAIHTTYCWGCQTMALQQ